MLTQLSYPSTRQRPRPENTGESLFVSVLIGLLFVGLLSPLGAAAEAQPDAGSSDPALEPGAIAVPDLSNLEAGVRLRVENLAQALGELFSQPGVDPRQLAEGHGILGQHYQAFDLLEAARDAYAQASRLAPEDFRWAYYHGLVLHILGEFEGAVASYAQALEHQPGDRASALRAGRTLLELGRLDEARKRFDSILAAEPAHAGALYGLAKVQAAEGNWESAIAGFERVLELQPEASIAHYPLAQAYRRAGQIAKAREHLALRGDQDVRFEDPLGSAVAWLSAGTALDVVRAMARSSDELPDRDYLGFALSQLAGVDGAATKLAEALDSPAAEWSSPLEKGRVHYVLGGLLVDRRDDDGAESQFRRALELAPSLLDARIKLGNIQARRQNWDAAIAAYSQVLGQDANNAPARLKRAAAHMATSNGDAAIPDLEALLSIDPAASEPRVRLATVKARLGQNQEALEHFRATLELDLRVDERAGIHLEIGNLLRASGDAQAAEAEFRAALEQDSQLAAAHFQLASLLGQRGNFHQAAESYRRVVELDPEHASARLGEVTALNLSGSFALAIGRLKEGLQVLPEAVELTHSLARLLAACPDRELRQGDEAVELAREAFEALPSFDHAITVAMALAEAGRFTEAVEWQETLIEQAEQRGDKKAAAQARAHLALYSRGKACCG